MIKLLQSDDRFSLAPIILPMLADDPIGPIRLMSLYRNVFFHYVGTKNNPMGQAFCFRDASSNFGRIPYLIYPLYDDITRLRSIERGAPLDEGTREEQRDEVKRFMQLTHYTDAMDLCYDSFMCLLTLSAEIERCTRVDSRTIVLTDADILEATIQHSDGTAAHFVKGEDGKLVQK